MIVLASAWTSRGPYSSVALKSYDPSNRICISWGQSRPLLECLFQIGRSLESLRFGEKLMRKVRLMTLQASIIVLASAGISRGPSSSVFCKTHTRAPLSQRCTHTHKMHLNISYVLGGRVGMSEPHLRSQRMKGLPSPYPLPGTLGFLPLTPLAGLQPSWGSLRPQLGATWAILAI